MFRIRANYEQERRGIVSALVESGYKVRLEYEFIKPPQQIEYVHMFIRELDEPEKNIYIIVEEVPENELCKVIG